MHLYGWCAPWRTRCKLRLSVLLMSRVSLGRYVSADTGQVCLVMELLPDTLARRGDQARGDTPGLRNARLS